MLTTLSTPRNLILGALPAADYQRLQPDLKQVKISHGEVIYASGEPIEYIYFPDDCIVSSVTMFDDGASVESGIVGREGAAGVSVALAQRDAPRETSAQTGGRCWKLPVNAFRGEFERGGALQNLVLSYAFAFFEQVAQAGACGNHHQIEERLARWLLMTHDRTNGDFVHVTQDFMAQMLGVHRPGVSHAAANLKDAGLIDYSRGTIRITDRRGLERATCRCYEVIRRIHENYLSFLELQSLNRRLDANEQAMRAEVERRRELQAVTRERVSRLRRAMSSIEPEADSSQMICACASCKNVRREDGAWQPVEKFIEEKLQLKTSHDICEPCRRKLYPGR